jgi:hypothetical protein
VRVDALDVVGRRRRVFALYAAVRAEAEPETAHARWRQERDDLFARHPATPVPAEQRPGFTGLVVAPYDAAWRFEAEVRPIEPTPWEVQTGTDGVVRFERLGVAELTGIGDLDVWRLTSYGGRWASCSPERRSLRTLRGSQARTSGTHGRWRDLLDQRRCRRPVSSGRSATRTACALLVPA